MYSMLAQDVILIAQANFTVGVRGSIPESRFDSSLTTLGVPRPKFSSIHARCSRAAFNPTPLKGIALLFARHDISM